MINAAFESAAQSLIHSTRRRAGQTAPVGSARPGVVTSCSAAAGAGPQAGAGPGRPAQAPQGDQFKNFSAKNLSLSNDSDP